MNSGIDLSRCEHPNTELRFRPDVNSNPRYQHQCCDCGEPVGNFIPVAAAEKLKPRDKIRPFDTVLQSKTRKQIKAEIAAAKAENVVAYHEYLKTDQWKRKRQFVLKRSNGMCEGCGEARATQVHHRTYEHIGDELLWELAAVCDACHEKAHADQRHQNG